MTEFSPENALEELLIKGATDPAARPAFYRELLSSKLIVIPTEAPDPAERKLSLARWQTPRGTFTPIFTSPRRVAEASQKNKPPHGVLAIEGAMLFRLLRQSGEGALLNPGLPCGKQFTTDEIRRIADGSIFEVGENLVVEKATQVFLGQPAVYPQRLVDALTRFAQERPSVEAAYLAQVFIPGDGDPHPVVGLASTDYPKDVKDAGFVASELGEPVPIDFVDMRGKPDETIPVYLRKESKPFYVRTKAKPWWKAW